jgi:hypothetical protein
MNEQGPPGQPAATPGWCPDPFERHELRGRQDDEVVTVITTVIQTGDHVYELTVTSPSHDRAGTLDDQMFSTFSLSSRG